MKVSVIIPTYKDWSGLGYCLKALMNQTYDKNLYEVIVVNNEPNTECPFTSLPSFIKIVQENKKGSYAARNKGISVASGDLLAFTDSDCIPDKNWLKNGVRKFESSNEIQRVGGEVALFFKCKKRTLPEMFEKAFSFRQDKYVTELKAAATANMWAYRKIFDTVGFFDENLMSGGDMEWGIRAYNHAIPIVYSREIIVKHPARSSMKELRIKAKRVAEGTQFRSMLGTIDDPMWLLKSFMPPIHSIKEVYKIMDISVYEKIMALLVLYYLKVYKGYCRIRFILDKKKSIRRNKLS